MQNTLSYIRHRQDWIFKAILILVSIALIVFILPNETKFKYEFQKGKPWLHDDLIAPFDFAIYKPQEVYNKEIQEAEQQNKFYFKLNDEVLSSKLKAYEKEFNNRWDSTAFNPNNSGKLNIKKVFKKITDSPQILVTRDNYFKFGENILKEIYSKGIIELHEVIDDQPEDYIILVLEDKVAQEKQIKDYYTLQKAYNYFLDAVKERTKQEADFYENIFESLLSHNVQYDQELTEKIRQQNIENISETYGAIQKDQKIVGQGDLITDETYQILNSLKIEYENKLGGSNNQLFVIIGQTLLVSLLIGIMIAFLFLFRKDIINENSKVAFILFLITVFVYIASISLKIPEMNLFIIPFCVLPVLIRAFYDVRLAIYTHIITILMIGFLAPNSFEFSVIQIIGGIAATYSVISIQKRSQIFISSFVIFMSYTLTYIGFSSIQEGTFKTIYWTNVGWFGLSALFTIIAYPLMYAFEKTFSFLSDVTLLELSDTNHALLRNLAEKAPGTFQHSIQVANLAEEAIRNIGGSALLVRVGALYHDIGKMNNPAFFIENQSGVNPHDELEYERSSQIIVKHVIDGIEMAKKHRLPEEIIDFIRTHHGNSTTGYFYKSYVNEHPDEQVDKSRFSYPGPLPFSKETAVLMMADACEAASRSLKKPTEESIKKLVEGIIDHQANENQFIHSNITFSDISLIKKLFTKKLVNIYHVRIEYPK